MGESRGPFWRRIFADRRGNVSAVMALLLVPLVGVLGMAVEGGSLFLVQRAAQNAADSAAIAAATNGCATGAGCATTKASYDQEARAAARALGFTNGSDDAVVTPSNTATCPDGTTCYSVQVQKKVAINLLRLVGFNGDTTLASGQGGQTVFAQAMAKKFPGTGFCVTAYGTAANSFELKGAPGLDLTGCDVYVPNGGASCNNDSGATIRFTYTATPMASNKPCGTATNQVAPGFDYGTLKSNIRDPNLCPGSGANKWPQQANANKISGSTSFTATSPLCGNVQLQANTTIASDSVLVIQNGRLDLNGYKLSTTNGAHLTIVMGGTSGSYNHTIMSSKNGAVLDYSAPTSGTWSGVAFYQNPDLTTGVDMSYAGNNPDFNITGLFYAPKSNLDVAGAINHATGGDACLAFMVKTLQINGTASIFAKPTRACDRAGLTGLGQVYDQVRLVM